MGPFGSAIENISISTSRLSKISFDNLNSILRAARANASDPRDFFQNHHNGGIPPIDFTNFNIYPINLREVRLHCVVNKFSELIPAASRIHYGKFVPSKTVYCFFLSKEDAIDFLYKIAKDEPSAFKRFGLGIHSVSLKEFFKLSEKKKDSCHMVIMNDLGGIEQCLKSSLNPQNPRKDFIFSFDKDLDFSKFIEGVLVYRINPQDLHGPLKNRYFLRLVDAVDTWFSLFHGSTIVFEEHMKPTVHVSVVSQDMLKKLFV